MGIRKSNSRFTGYKMLISCNFLTCIKGIILPVLAVLSKITAKKSFNILIFGSINFNFVG